jgi:hypothetical protein
MVETENIEPTPAEKQYSEMSVDLEFDKVQQAVKKLNLSQEDEQMLNRYLSTVVQYTSKPQTRALAYECLQFIFRQLNPDTFISEFNDEQYTLYITNSADALFGVVYLKYYDAVDFQTRRALFWSTFNFMDMLFNRILRGRGKRYNVDITQAKNPPRIQTGGN